MEGRKILVLATAALAFSFLTVSAVYQSAQESREIAIEAKKFPTIGTGSIEMIVFEDFRCKTCRTFTESIFPQIASHYILSGRVKYTFVPVAFLQGSKPLANAALGVYRQAPERFFAFVHELFKIEKATSQAILDAAKKVGHLDLALLKECIDQELYYQELDENLAWAKEQIGNRFGTPLLLINGVPTSTQSFQAIEERIREIEEG